MPCGDCIKYFALDGQTTINPPVKGPVTSSFVSRRGYTTLVFYLTDDFDVYQRDIFWNDLGIMLDSAYPEDMAIDQSHERGVPFLVGDSDNWYSIND
jgi:hypothetical protein